MINLTKRLDKAMRVSAWAHEQQNQHRKGTDIPYAMHPFAAMLIASNVTDDEDILIACLLHDILEDVKSEIYSDSDMARDFGGRVVDIVKGVTKNDEIDSWKERSLAYLKHLENQASDEAVIVSASDKIHNLISILSDFDKIGSQIWLRFSTNNSEDQLWWYQEILKVIRIRQVPEELANQLSDLVDEAKKVLGK